MKNYIPVLLVALSLATPFSPVNAQAGKLTLQQAIEMGLKNSHQLKAARARIDIATAYLEEAKNNKLPNFNVSGAYLRILQPNITLANKPSSGQGGSAVPTINQAAYGIASISYPVYAGGKINYGIQSAKYLQQAAALDADNDKQAVIYNIINAYINYYKAGLTADLLRKHLEVSRQRDSSFSHLEQNGLLARNDLLKTELQTSNIELGLLDAESEIKIAAISLNLLLGLQEGNSITIDTSSIKNEQIKALEQYETLAFQNRKDLQAFEIRNKASLLAIKSAKAEAYPTLALTGGYIAAYIPGFVTITNAVNAGIGIQYNLASLWKTNSKMLQAKATQAETLAREQQLNDEVRLQLNQAYQAYLLNNKKVEVYEKTAQQAAENYRITKNKYDNSLATITDLLEADVANRQAELNIVLAKADAVSLYNKLLETTGTLNY